MIRKYRLSCWLVGAVLFAAIDCAGVIAIETALISPAQAQSGFPFSADNSTVRAPEADFSVDCSEALIVPPTLTNSSRRRSITRARQLHASRIRKQTRLP